MFHIILNCEVVNETWQEMTPTLLKLHPNAVRDEEKAFGLIIKNKSPGILLRNWLTYLLRFCTTQLEREAHFSSYDIRNRIKMKVQHEVEERVQKKFYQYSFENKLNKFHKIFSHENAICSINEGDEKYTIRRIFN